MPNAGGNGCVEGPRAAVKRAEEDLARAKAQHSDKEVIVALEQQLEKRKQAVQTAKTLPERLGEVTRAEKSAQAALQRVEERMAKLQTELDSARQTHLETTEALRAVTAEVAADNARRGGIPAPDATSAAAAAAQQAADQAAESTLQSIIEAYWAACIESPEKQDKQRSLEAALKQAADAKAAGNAAAEVKASEEAATVEEERIAAEQADRKREIGSTQPGDMELDDEALGDLLASIPPSKRQRARDRLTQMGVADVTSGGS